MLQQLPPQSRVTPELHHFIRDLLVSGFQGDIATDEASLSVVSTDNSIWQTTPQAVIAPKTKGCVEAVVSLLAQPAHRDISITPRGGGTSTAGQSLTNSIVLDCKRYMNRILNFDPRTSQVHVECGAVLQTINDELQEHGVMIGPTVATASRATIGGMIGNDSAGKGSCVYGKTSDCIVELETVLRGGEIWKSTSIDNKTLTSLEQTNGCVGEIHRAVRHACDAARPYLADHWPKLPRFVTGYNLPMAWDGTAFNLNRILCGAEGTLGVTTSACLQCVPLPTNRQLLLICFDSFDSALRCGTSLMQYNPTAIETVDDMVVQALRDDASWSQVSQLLGSAKDDTGAILFVAFSDSNIATIQEAFDEARTSDGVLLASIIQDPSEIHLAWSFRDRSVGLLSSIDGNRTPIPFVEDCAVPPEVLPEFIREFRQLLDKHDLRAGMFGHIDAGVIHVRPALDMQSILDRNKVRVISDEVASLVRKFRGVLWGEHGKGFRSEFGPSVFGEEIWQQMCRVKTAFDPHNQFNPQKVAVPNASIPIASLDTPTRGNHDASMQQLPVLSSVTRCDGNSECLSSSMHQGMCPTYRVTGDPVHSPRGRSEVLRHWLSRIGDRNIGRRGSFFRRLLNSGGSGDYSHDVRSALDGCLSCKACSTDCPMQIDIPSVRAHFYEAYFGRYPRPLRDFAWLHMESLLPFLSTKFGRLVPVQLLASLIGIADPPRVVIPSLATHLKQRGVRTSTQAEIVQAMPSVVLLQDSFTTYFRPSVFLAMIEIITQLQLSFAVLPLRPCGKSNHIRGDLRTFNKIAQRNMEWISPIQNANIPIVGIDPAATLLWRDEYPAAVGQEASDSIVLLPQEWLIQQDLSSLQINGTWRLFPHCIERACAIDSSAQWERVFKIAGAELQLIETACCGMGGLFGHQKEYKNQSSEIWNQQWIPHKPNADNSLTTGYSCHSQAMRMSNITLRHPLEVMTTLSDGLQ